MDIKLPPESAHISPARLQPDITTLCALVDMGYEVEGEAVLSESLWVVYGRSTYDGEVILAEYTHAAEAAAVLEHVTTMLR
ncbi:MAG: hypothetical protein R2702_08135 [Acidimicrobiales bacterium]